MHSFACNPRGRGLSWSAMKLLLIEDDADTATMIRRRLEQEHYEVTLAAEGNRGLELALDESFALIMLDLELPGLDGLRICEELRRRRRTTPILMLTARHTVPDRVRGLETGADDYLPKPFEFSELLARIQALLRRERVHRARVIRIADLEIDTGTRRVTRAGREVELTPREYSLLEALASQEGRVLSREVIQSRIWHDDRSSSNTVDVHIAALRRKLEAGRQARLIHTVTGVGYTLRARARR